MTTPKTQTGALARQQAIYSAGMSGSRPTVPTDYAALEAAAEKAMSEQAYAYIAGGAGRESTMAANRRAFERWRIVPRMLRDVETRDTSVELFGRRLPSPFVLCPIGVLEMAHAEADIAVARAAAARGVPMLFSNQASRSMEDCTAAMQQVQAVTERMTVHLAKADVTQQDDGGKVAMGFNTVAEGIAQH